MLFIVIAVRLCYHCNMVAKTWDELYGPGADDDGMAANGVVLASGGIKANEGLFREEAAKTTLLRLRMGDMAAVREVHDRLDGKAIQQQININMNAKTPGDMTNEQLLLEIRKLQTLPEGVTIDNDMLLIEGTKE